MKVECIDRTPWLLRKLVLPQHTDHASVMWHGSYLLWLEEARVLALESVGMSYSELSHEGYEMPVYESNIKFSSPIYHGEKVSLQSWLMPSKSIKLVWKTIFLPEGRDKAAEAIISLVITKKSNGHHRAVREIPSSLSESIKKLRIGPI